MNDLTYGVPSRYMALDDGSASGLKIITSTFAFPVTQNHYFPDSETLETLLFQIVNCF